MCQHPNPGPPAFCRNMSDVPVRRSARNVPGDDPPPQPLPSVSSADSECPSSARTNPRRVARVPKCKVGERYKVPGSEFDEGSDDDEPHPDYFFGVVTHVQKTGCKMLFKGGEELTRYDGFLESWRGYLVTGDDIDDAEEKIFQDVEIKAKLRALGRVVERRTRSPDRGGEGRSDDGGPVGLIHGRVTWKMMSPLLIPSSLRTMQRVMEP